MTSETLQKSPAVCASATLERLLQYKLEPTPNNFAVFYTYFSGSDPNLTMALDLLQAKFDTLSQNQVSEIYQGYLGLEAEHRVLQQTSIAVESELKRLLSVLDQNLSGTYKYNQTLDAFTGTVEASKTLEEIRTALNKVVQDTRVMVDQNQRLQTQLAKSTEQLTEVRLNLDIVRKDSLIDPLTEVGNRKFFSNELTRATQEVIGDGTALSLLMIDIDHFKKFNDSYGHLIGDQVLKLVAHTLVENLKGRDVIARYGGEEFVILMPSTRVYDAERVANQIRSVLATKQIQRKKTGETLGIVTISIGATEYYHHEDLEGFVNRADEALYMAKQTGRNKVVTKVLTPEEIQSLKTTNAAPDSF